MTPQRTRPSCTASVRWSAAETYGTRSTARPGWTARTAAHPDHHSLFAILAASSDQHTQSDHHVFR